MNIVNLNKHVIVVVFNGVETRFEPSGMVASVEVKQEKTCEVNGIPCSRNKYGSIVGLPESEASTLFLVNALVLERAKIEGRFDCIAPDTGPSAIREKGQVVAVVGFVS